MKSHNSHLTAITRKDFPVPTRWLMKQSLIRGKVLDYGCGKCYTINPIKWDNFDPHYYPSTLIPGYDTILCNYVLCTLPADERLEVLQMIKFFLKSDGIAYISVRNDKPKQGWGISKRKTYQGRVRNLNLPLLYKNSHFRIYKLTANTKL